LLFFHKKGTNFQLQETSYSLLSPHLDISVCYDVISPLTPHVQGVFSFLGNNNAHK